MGAIEARKAVESFFTAFNNKDVESLLKTMHFPHMRINGQGRMSLIMNEHDAKLRWDMAFIQLPVVEEWSHSSLDSVEVVHESEVKVHFKIVFSRYKSDGSKYAVYESLWIVTKRDDGWAIITRSSFAP